MDTLLKWYYTLRPLKPAQWWYRLVQPLMKRCSSPRNAKRADLAFALQLPRLDLIRLNVPHCFEPATNTFLFLNLSHTFPGSIDWNFEERGLLWTYNLHYFEWLYDDSLSVEDRLSTIRAFCERQHSANEVAFHPYPASLRIQAWTRFLLRFDIKDEVICSCLFRDADWLMRFPEYHVQGNHLWENALALVSAGIFFQNKKWYQYGLKLLANCTQDQVLADGGHVEGSPMYHSLLLWRLLQMIELMRKLRPDESLLQHLEGKAAQMGGWLRAMTFSDGSWPMFNDCAFGIAPSTQEVMSYLGVLGISVPEIGLSASGYRMIRAGRFELAIDLAPVQPAWQPGHTHADLGTFCLHLDGKPLVVDTGTSTYVVSERRAIERSTAAHNTVQIGNENSTEVWKSFRAGRRAIIRSITETGNSIKLRYSAYKRPELILTRTFLWNDNCVAVHDQSEGGDERIVLNGHLHFDPDIKLQPLTPHSFRAGNLNVRCSDNASMQFDEYGFACGFNRVRPAPKMHFTATSDLFIEFY